MKKIIFLLLIVLMLIYIVPVYAEGVIKSEKELYEKMATDCMNFTKSATYTTSFKVESLSLDKIIDITAKKNQILGNNVNAFKYQIQGNIISIQFGYLLTQSEYDACISITKKIADRFTDDMTDYEKVKMAHDYLCDAFEYSYIHNGPYDALTVGLSDCEGYAMSFQMIMEHAGIQCEYITGDMHAWNIVMVDGDWYNIDVTWDDTDDVISYEYFLKSAYDFDKHDVNLKCSPINYNPELAQKYGMKNLTRIYKYGIIFVVGMLAIMIIINCIKNLKHIKKLKEEPVTFKEYNWSEKRQENIQDKERQL